MKKQYINDKIINEIKSSDVKNNIKNFLIKLLNKENLDEITYNYKEEYKKIIKDNLN